MAAITANPKCPGGLERDFADKAKGDACYMLPALEPGNALEFGADYYSGGGKKSAHRWYGYVLKVTPEYLYLHHCSTPKAAIREGATYFASLDKTQGVPPDIMDDETDL